MFAITKPTSPTESVSRGSAFGEKTPRSSTSYVPPVIISRMRCRFWIVPSTTLTSITTPR